MHNKSLPPSDRLDADTPATEVNLQPALSTHTKKVRQFNVLLRDKVRELRDAPNSIWSNAKLALRVGMSSAVISQYLNEDGCRYEGDIPGLERKLDDFLRNEERRRTSGIETTWCDAAEQIKTAFEYIRRSNDVGGIVAESGEGKTRGIELILQENPLAILFTVRAWSCDKSSIQSALWECVPHIGYSPNMKRASFMVTSMRGSDRPLIVDDAHKLTRPALHWLFDFYDETNIPIILIGTADLLAKLEDDAQRFTRAGIYITVKTNWNKSEGRATGHSLINKMIDTLASDVNGDRKELIDLCEQVAKEHGHFRSVHKQLKLAAEIRSSNAKSVENGETYRSGPNAAQAVTPITWPKAFAMAHTMLIRKYKLT